MVLSGVWTAVSSRIGLGSGQALCQGSEGLEPCRCADAVVRSRAGGGWLHAKSTTFCILARPRRDAVRDQARVSYGNHWKAWQFVARGAWRWMRSEGSHSERESPSCGQGGEGGPDLILASRNQVPLKDPKRDTAKTAGTSGHGRRGRAHELKRISLIWV